MTIDVDELAEAFRRLRDGQAPVGDPDRMEVDFHALYAVLVAADALLAHSRIVQEIAGMEIDFDPRDLGWERAIIERCREEVK